MFGSSDDEGDDEVYDSQSGEDSGAEDKYADPIDLDGHNYPQWVKNTLGCRLQVRISINCFSLCKSSLRFVSPRESEHRMHVTYLTKPLPTDM